jgi:acyl-CoA synthetase (AMP-forming)/AMP-acid ligase II
MTQPPPRDIPSLLSAMASRGEERALSFYRGKTLEGRLTYAALAADVEALGAELGDRYGVRAGDRVAILAPNRLEIPVLVLAILRVGGVVVPLNPGSAPSDWEYILRHSGASGVCATRDLAERVPEGARPRFMLHVEDALARLHPPGRPPRSAGRVEHESLEEDLAVVLYTSGTTGDPKGVALRQRNLLANAASMADNFGFDRTAQLAVLPLYHAHAFGFGLMTALATGGHLVFCERLEPFTWAHVIRSESVEVTSVVPTLLPMLLAAGITAEKVPSLRHIMVSSAPLPTDLARTFETRTGIPLVQGWGLSEYTNFACCMPPRAPKEEHDLLMFTREVPSIGPALAGTEVEVRGGDGAPLGEGSKGELVVRGHSMMAGYYEDPENTARTIDGEGWLHTGDEGFYVVHAGRPVFFVTGRIKETIIRDAEKYSPLGLERRIVGALPDLAGKLVVLGFPHAEHGEEVGAYVEVASMDGAAQAALAAVLEGMLLAERPKVVLFGARPIPRTHTGKVQRRKMQPWFADWARHRGSSVIRELVG